MNIPDRTCWICSQRHNPSTEEVHARLYGHSVRCKHREPEVELAIARAIEARERREK